MEKIKLLLYCTKSKKNTLYNVLGKYITSNYLGKDFMQNGRKQPELNGKIVAECDFEVEEIKELGGGDGLLFYTKTLDCLEIVKQACLKTEELADYLYKEYEDSKGYAIHIKNLHIFDKPRELWNYETQEIWNNTSHYHRTIMKAPQNMMYVYDCDTKEKKVLISIRPEYLVRILNKEKTIEIRKQILNCMKGKNKNV